MAYSHGKKWSEKDIEDAIIDVVNKLCLKTFPTHSEMNSIYGNSLSNKISKTGGTEFWAKKMGMKIKNCESKLGNSMEEFICSFLSNKGYDVEKMKPRYPYDVTVNRNVKIDVKTGFLFKSNNGSSYYTFNLDKRFPTCDIYVVYCLNENKTILKTYVIPSCVLYGKTQLSIGINRSKYDKYVNRWDFLDMYNEFYDNLFYDNLINS